MSKYILTSFSILPEKIKIGKKAKKNIYIVIRTNKGSVYPVSAQKNTGNVRIE